MFERIKQLVQDINGNYNKYYECYSPRDNKISFVNGMLDNEMFFEILPKAHKDVYASEILVNVNEKTLEFYE